MSSPDGINFLLNLGTPHQLWGYKFFSRRQAKYNKVLSKIKNKKNIANKIIILYVNLTQ